MTEMSEGWYHDPAPANPGEPNTMRWWDGGQWTARLRPATRAERAAWHQQQAAQRMQAAAEQAEYAAQRGGDYPGRPGVLLITPPPRDYTPDGQRLAGWWHRVAAYILDAIVLGVVSTAIGWPFISRIGTAYGDFFRATIRASQNGTPPPSQADLLSQVTGPMLGFVAVSLAISFVYQVTFLKTLQATPGKLAVGLRVRLRERPGSLPWSSVLLRWLVQNAGALVYVVPVVGTLGGLYSLLDDLWPLWDGKRQALHDHAARTNVVRVRG